jgi:phosphodiesterase/alkaline phosphatase D-like protein
MAAAAGAAVVTRGPYLQQGTPTSVIVRWRTNVATNGRVRYGQTLGALSSFRDQAASTTEHQVTLTGLKPDTRYYYSVGTTAAPLAGDATYFFRSAPAIGPPHSLRIWATGDFGTGNARAMAVRDAYEAFAGNDYTNLWLMLGDNAY